MSGATGASMGVKSRPPSRVTARAATGAWIRRSPVAASVKVRGGRVVVVVATVVVVAGRVVDVVVVAGAGAAPCPPEQAATTPRTANRNGRRTRVH